MRLSYATSFPGYYDPFNTMRSHIYPAIHSAYGFVYADDGKSSDECKLIVKTNNGGDKIFYLRATKDKLGIMRSFQQTIATDDGMIHIFFFSIDNL